MTISGRVVLHSIQLRASRFFGINQGSTIQAGRRARIGLLISGALLLSVVILIVLISPLLVVLALPIFLFGAYNLIASRRSSLSLSRSNILAFFGHLLGTVTLYLLLTRGFWVTYMTDSIVGSYMGILKVLSLQDPYSFSIKPFLDQFGFPPSLYTPRIDGSFEFHLNYPALNFLTLLPFYVAGLHDLRDGVFIFHLVSVLVIFGLVPSRQKALSLASFVFFPVFIAASWTDSVWAFFLVGSAVFWYRNRDLSMLMLGLAGATKQIALIAAPFLLIRLWKESPTSKLRNTLVGAAVAAAGFLGPNIPFLLSNPSQWWQATIAPYFPGNAAQVPGGIGLSGLLLDVGVVPPVLVFVGLMVVMGIGSLYLYTTRYSKSGFFVWFFPVTIMFFYYRSFPNYLLYWAFPLAVEFFRKRPSFSFWRFSPLQSIPWHPSIGSTLRSVRGRIRIPLIASLLLSTVFVGAFGAYVSSPSSSRVLVEVNSISDPDGIGAATQLSVTLNNLTPKPVVPSLFVKWYFLPNVWTSNSSRTLAPSTSATYLLTATDGLAAVPRTASFRVYVFDSTTGNLVGESDQHRADTQFEPIANPNFRWWTLDIGAGEKVPYNWKLTKANMDPLSPVVQALGGNQGDGITMSVNYTSAVNNLEKVTISQKVQLNATRINLSLFDQLSTSLAEKAVLGVSITDGPHQLSYIFSNSTRNTVSSSSNYNVTATIPIKASEWTVVSIDGNLAWQAQGWATPQTVTFTIFIQANSPGLYSASIQRIS